MMSLKEASEIVTSATCPHCEAPQYLNVMQLGQNLACATCGGEYGAPAAPGARATKTLWGPRAEVPPEPPAETSETPIEVLARLRQGSLYWGTRRLASILSVCASVILALVLVGLGFMQLGRDSLLGAVGYVLSAVGVVLFIQLIHGVIRAILDVADMTAYRHLSRLPIDQ
jgi:hypothetical protein